MLFVVWGRWSVWGPCINCVQAKRRYCLGGSQCRGRNTKTRTCQNGRSACGPSFPIESGPAQSGLYSFGTSQRVLIAMFYPFKVKLK